MKTTTLLLKLIGDARMAVQDGQQEVTVQVGMARVRVWREGPGIEGIKERFLPNS